MAYYLKAAWIIARSPRRILGHRFAGKIVSQIARREFRLHWLRDIAAGCGW